MAEAMRHGLTAIVPCNDIDASEAFYNRLGFFQPSGGAGTADYRMLIDGKGGEVHLTRAVEGWLVPGRNPFGLYFYTKEVDRLATLLADMILEPGRCPEHKPWGMYEFALSDPDEALVRIGWPSRLLEPLPAKDSTPPG